VPETTTTFQDVVGPMRAEFAVCLVTGQLPGRRSGRLARLLRGLAVLGCAQGHALVTPAATGVHVAGSRPRAGGHRSPPKRGPGVPDVPPVRTGRSAGLRAG